MQTLTSTQPSADLRRTLHIEPVQDGLFILKGQNGLSFEVGRYFPTGAATRSYARLTGFQAAEG